MPDCQMCWNEWPTLTPTPFPALAGIMVCRNCGRSMKQMLAFCRNHGLDILAPSAGENSDPETAVSLAPDQTSADEPPQPPQRKAGKGT